MHQSATIRRRTKWLVASMAIAMVGCGTMKSQTATDQLLISDAIERAADQIDFSSLNGATIYLDTQYMSKVTAQGFLNSDYIRSALRQRLMQNHCHLVDKAADAEYIVEVRVGALGTDAHEVNYGIPGSQSITATASLFTGAGSVPALPEVSLARKDERRGAAKIHVFAYRRETMEPVWQPSVSHGQSSAQSTWVLGAGPFEKGTIYEKARFAGSTIDVKPLPPIDSLRDGIKLPSLLVGRKPTDDNTLVNRPASDVDGATANISDRPNDSTAGSAGNEAQGQTAAIGATHPNPNETAVSTLPDVAIPTTVATDASAGEKTVTQASHQPTEE